MTAYLEHYVTHELHICLVLWQSYFKDMGGSVLSVRACTRIHVVHARHAFMGI